MNRLDRRALSNRRLKRKLTDTAQIKSQRRQSIVRNKSLECVVDTNHAHVVGHGQARVLERGDNASAIWSFAASTAVGACDPPASTSAAIRSPMAYPLSALQSPRSIGAAST